MAYSIHLLEMHNFSLFTYQYIPYFVSCLWTQSLSRNFDRVLSKVDGKDILFHFFHSFFSTDAYEDGVYLLTSFTANQVITLAHIYLTVTLGDFILYF